MRLNYAENCLKRRDEGIALTYAREDIVSPGAVSKVQHLTWREMREMVSSFAAALRAEGIQVGDRVGCM